MPSADRLPRLPPDKHSARRTPSGIELPLVATSLHHGTDDSLPGEYPFTRGIFADGYRGRTWTMRQYAGFGTAEESNKRYQFLLAQGQTGLSVALDLPTQCGHDPIDSIARAEVGKVGVSLCNLSEMETLFEGIDLQKISTSFTINGTAAIIYAMYVACADKQGIPRASLTGTIQNDILKEYVARGTWIFPVQPSMRLVADTILYANTTTPRFNPISIAGAHVRDAGVTAVEEIAYTCRPSLAPRPRSVVMVSGPAPNGASRNDSGMCGARQWLQRPSFRGARMREPGNHNHRCLT